MIGKTLQLGELADPAKFSEPLNLPVNTTKDEATNLLRSLLLVRIVEETIADFVKTKEVDCPCHLSIGQEAIAVGVAQFLNKTDRVFGTHRSHAHYLALGGDAYKLLAEVFGRQDGCAGGLGGSMHLIDQQNGFLGSVPIVAGTIPLAAGSALAAKLQKTNDIAVCFFGDGATEEGVFHETMNLAAIQKLPILFVCENNLYASHLDIKQRQPSDSIARYAQAHCIDFKVVDGNDVYTVINATKELVQNVRAGNGPAFLEAVTYRWLGHVGANEDIDVGVRRSTEELSQWKKRDPIKRLFDGMLVKKFISEAGYQKLYDDLLNEVQTKLDLAKKTSYPTKDKLQCNVYSV